MTKGNFFTINGKTYKCIGYHQTPYSYVYHLQNVSDPNEMVYITEQTPQEIEEECASYSAENN